MWCPWLVGGTIYCSAGRHRKISSTGESLIQTPKAYARAGPWRRPHSMHPWLHHASTDGGSCPPSHLLLLVGTSKKSLGEKMVAYALELCSASQSETTHQRRTNHASWQQSIAELRWEVGFYLSFTDEEVYRGVDLPRRGREQTLNSYCHCCWCPWCTTTTVETLPIWKVAPNYAGWDTILHPSWPVIAAGEVPHSTTLLHEWREESFDLSRPFPSTHHPKPPRHHLHQRSSPPAKALALVKPPPLHIMALLEWPPVLGTPDPVEVDWDTPVGAMPSLGWYQTLACQAFAQAGWWKMMKWGWCI